jgi:hypothetical protein
MRSMYLLCVENVECGNEQDNDLYLDEVRSVDGGTGFVELHPESENNDFKNVVECMGGNEGQLW